MEKSNICFYRFFYRSDLLDATVVDVVVAVVAAAVVAAAAVAADVVVELNLANYNKRRLQRPREISGKEIFFYLIGTIL